MPKINWSEFQVPREWANQGALPRDVFEYDRGYRSLATVPNENIALEGLKNDIQDRLARTRFKPGGDQVGGNYENNPQRFINLLGSIFPQLMSTRSGVPIGRIPVYASGSARSYHSGHSGDLGAIFLSDPERHPQWLDSYGITPEHALAAAVSHETIHGARKLLGRPIDHEVARPASLMERAAYLRGERDGIPEQWARGVSGTDNLRVYEDIPYFRQTHEESARRGEFTIAKKLLQGQPGPLLGLAAVPGLFDALHQWSQTQGDHPVPEFLRGAVNGVSPTGDIPSTDQLQNIYAAAFDPSSPRAGAFGRDAAHWLMNQVAGVTHAVNDPQAVIKAVAESFFKHPAYGAGNLAAMFLPQPGEFLKMAQGEARAAEAALGNKHIQDWNLQQYEGPTNTIAPPRMPELEARLREVEQKFSAAFDAGDVAAQRKLTAEYGQLKSLQTNNPIFTREERGGEMLQKLGIEDPLQKGTADQLVNLVMDNLHDLKNLRDQGFSATTQDAFNRAKLPPQATSERLAQTYPNAPHGQTMWQNGEQWVNTKRGWTRNEDAPGPKGPHAPPELIGQVARVVRDKGAAWGVEEAIRHGGMEQKWASTLVANMLSTWSASKVKLTPEQNAWLELYKSGKYKP